MKLRLLFASVLLAGLAGCATYDYSGGNAGYYRGTPSVQYRYPPGYYNYGYGYPGYGYPYYGPGIGVYRSPYYHGGGYYVRPPSHRPPRPRPGDSPGHRPPPNHGVRPPDRPAPTGPRPDRPPPNMSRPPRPSAPPTARPRQPSQIKQGGSRVRKVEP